MNKVFAIGALALTIAAVGCGGSGEPTNVMQGQGEEAIRSYEEMVAAEEAMMSQGDASDEVAEAAPTEQ